MPNVRRVGQQARGPALSRLQLTQLVLLSVAAILVLRATLIELALDGADLRAADALSVTTTLATARRDMTLDHVPAAALALATAALGRAPLDHAPFEVIGTDRARRISPEAGLPAMLAARSRRPTSLLVRTWLARYYLQHGDMPNAVDELGTLIVLGNTGAIQALVQLARLPRVRPAIAAMLQRRGQIASEFLRQAGSAGLPPEVLVQLAGSRLGDGEIAGSNAIVASFVQTGDYRRAYLAWIVSLPENALGKVGSIFNGAFEDVAAAAPFNWSLTNRPTARAMLEPSGGLSVFVTEQQPASLAEQSLVLAPGRYRLAGKAVGPSEDGATLGWRLTCLPDAAGALATLPIATSENVARTVDTQFAVPVTCPGQKLSLLGSGGTTSPALATIENVRIEALDAVE